MAVLPNNLKMILPLCRVVQVIVKHVFVLLRVWVVAIDVIENRILNPSKAEPAIKHSTTVVPVSLPKPRVLVQLG